MSETAEAVQARLDAKRAEQPPPPEPVMLTCSECGDEFEQPEVAGNLKLPEHLEVLPKMCRKCYGEFRSRPVQPDSNVPAPSSVQVALDGMEKVGVNVRRHGRLVLADLPTESQRLGTAFVQAILGAGNYGEVEGLYIWGPTGTGKSQLAVAVIHHLLRLGTMRPRDIVYDRARSMVTQLQDRYTTGRVDEFSDVRRKARLWVYEDAGTEKHTPDAFRVFEDIFDRREGHPTVVTSNLSRDELAQRWKQHDTMGRFLSRLQSFNSLKLAGADRRT